MKTTTPIKKTMQAIMVTVLIVSSVIITKNIIHHIKYLYSLQPAGMGLSCFLNMMQ